MKTLIAMFGLILAVGTSTVTAGTNAGSTRVQASTEARGAPGSPIGVEIDFTGLPKSAAASVSYATEGDLTLTSPARKQLTADGKGFAHDKVVVQAKSAGVYFLNVFASVNGMTKAVSIPVTVGQAQYKPRAAKSVGASDAQQVIEMPAQEVIRPAK
ncbi:hypothetical protein [Caballeronia sp. J97]|uniref:hypothetical protein n=1 Tax=Caballeronia sp. J97 TaxID=2805429 RepID=UPI002AB10FC9|nr:hypothetical protein [Caballeronia sp. J97]